jgi:hypothetical protein
MFHPKEDLMYLPACTRIHSHPTAAAAAAAAAGHNHYVMCAMFHPKEDLIVSASLDLHVLHDT